MRLWASDSKRVIDTARYFAAGLFGISSDWVRNDIAEVDVIPESSDRGSDTLTPGDTCLRYIEDTDFGHDYGRNMLARFQNAYIPPIARRLVDEEGNQAVGGFTNLEVYSMQEMCGFETLARGSSPWCDVFTSRDWDHFEYARDLIHFYRAGPGNKYAGAMGWLWLNATSHLLEAGPDVGTMFISLYVCHFCSRFCLLTIKQCTRRRYCAHVDRTQHLRRPKIPTSSPSHSYS